MRHRKLNIISIVNIMILAITLFVLSGCEYTIENPDSIPNWNNYDSYISDNNIEVQDLGVELDPVSFDLSQFKIKTDDIDFNTTGLLTSDTDWKLVGRVQNKSNRNLTFHLVESSINNYTVDFKGQIKVGAGKTEDFEFSISGDELANIGRVIYTINTKLSAYESDTYTSFYKSRFMYGEVEFGIMPEKEEFTGRKVYDNYGISIYADRLDEDIHQLYGKALYFSINNESNSNIRVKIENAFIGDTELSTVGEIRAYANTLAKDKIYVNGSDDTVNKIENISDIEYTIKIFDIDAFEEIDRLNIAADSIV